MTQAGDVSLGSSTRRKPATDLVAFAAILVVAIVSPAAFSPILLSKIACFALFAISFNLLSGYAGLLSFGHAMFFGGAAYLAGHAIKVWGLPTELSILAGGALAGAMGFLVGLLAIRRQGIYFAMTTLAFAQMFYFFCYRASFSGGEDGLQQVPRTPVLGFIDIRNDLTLYYVVLTIAALGFLIVYRTIHSPFGQTLKAIRENETRAVSLGYRTESYKLLAMVLSAALAGVAGATKTVVFQLASLTDISWHTSGDAVLMTLVGGMGTMLGPIAGAAIIIAIQEYLSGLDDWVLVINGLIFASVVLVFRRGVVGEILRLVGR